MNNIFSFRLPAKPNLLDEVISIMETWVNSSPFYSFENLSLKDVRTNATYACTEAEFEYIRIADKEGRNYIGTRLSKPDASNVEWFADFIYECGSDGNFFYIQLSRGIIEPNRITNMRILPKMPDVVKLIAQHNMLLDDAGFQITDVSLPLSPHVLRLCNDALEQKTVPILPIIFANCAGLPEEEKTMASIARDFAGMVHIIVAVSEDETARLAQIDLLDPSFSGATICFPRIGIVKKISFQEEFKDILMCMTAYISQQNLPVNTMSWEKLKSLLGQAPDSTPLADNSASGGYYLMNSKMAELMKTTRKKLGLSQVELASAAGTTGLIISRLETLRITRVKEHLLRQIEQALNFSVGTISALEGERSGGDTSGTLSSEAGREPPELPNSGGKAHPIQSRFCRKCGAKLFSDSIFCHQCGIKLPDNCPESGGDLPENP